MTKMLPKAPPGLTPRNPTRYGPIMLIRSRNKQIPTTPGARADGASMRAHNTGLLLHHIFEQEPISRAALARTTGMARSTVGAIVGELVEAGVLTESPGTARRAGRPPIALRVQANRFHIVGVEMGASHVTLVHTNLRGTVLGRCSVDHPVERDPEGALATIRRLIDALVPPADRPRLVGAGLAVPSPLDPTAPGRLSERILPAWAGVRPAHSLGERLGLPVYMENDANLGALAEAWWGRGRGRGDFAFIKLATGVGAGMIVSGEIYGGASGIAGEIGHTTIDPSSDHQCRCGRHGCLEALIGTHSLVGRALAEMTNGAKTRLQPAGLDLASLIDAAHAGDPLATDLMRQAGHQLGTAIANLLNLLNPGAVVLGGTLPTAGPVLLDAMRAAMRERVLSASLETTDVLVSSLGEDGIALGAATLVLQRVLAEPALLLQSRAETAELGASQTA